MSYFTIKFSFKKGIKCLVFDLFAGTPYILNRLKPGMLNQQDYLIKAKSSDSFLAIVSELKQRYLEWEIIIAFYTALQYVDTYLKGELKREYDNHGTRNDLIKKHLPKIWPAYLKLLNDGHKARYHPGYNPDVFAVLACKDSKETIRSYILNLLK